MTAVRAAVTASKTGDATASPVLFWSACLGQGFVLAFGVGRLDGDVGCLAGIALGVAFAVRAWRECFDFVPAAGDTSLTTRRRCPATSEVPDVLFQDFSSCGVTS